MVCQRWWMTKWCVKDGVRKRVCDKVVCQRWCVTKLCAKDGVSKSKKVCDEMPHCQPSATSATPATQMEGQCHQVPRLPREAKVDVTSATPATQSTVTGDQAPKRAQARHQS